MFESPRLHRHQIKPALLALASPEDHLSYYINTLFGGFVHSSKRRFGCPDFEAEKVSLLKLKLHNITRHHHRRVRSTARPM